MQHAYELNGQLTDARSLVLDEPLPLACGPVRVTVRSLAPVPRKSRRDGLAEVHSLLATAGHVSPSPDEVTRRIAEERDAWK